MKPSRKVVVECTLLGLLVGLTVFSGVYAQEGQVTIHPIHDAYTSTEAPETNYGDAPYLKVTMTDAYTRFIWLKFNLSAVPDGARVTSATVELYAYVVVHFIELETYDVSAHFCSDNTWSEQSITYLTQRDCDDAATSSVLIETTEQWYIWDVTNLVKRQVDGIFDREDEATIFLQENRHHQEGFNVIFFSKEHWEEQYFPKLVVQWSGIELDVPEFPWASILLVTLLLSFVTPVVLIVLYKRTRKH